MVGSSHGRACAAKLSRNPERHQVPLPHGGGELPERSRERSRLAPDGKPALVGPIHGHEGLPEAGGLLAELRLDHHVVVLDVLVFGLDLVDWSDWWL
jgi:hypothetical protein